MLPGARQPSKDGVKEMKVLIAEDDRITREGLAEILINEGYDVLLAENGKEALEKYSQQKPDFLCLDIMMPEADGYTVCREIRAFDPDIPIIFISAKSEEIDKVVGLELGADDFIVKPFGIREVVARIRAVTRRCLRRIQGKFLDENTPTSFSLGDLEILPQELRARRNGKTIELSFRDVKLLEVFGKNPGIALDRFTLFSAVWGEDHIAGSRTLDQHISQLRKRIEKDPRQPELIKTVHGVGYRYDLQ